MKQSSSFNSRGRQHCGRAALGEINRGRVQMKRIGKRIASGLLATALALGSAGTANAQATRPVAASTPSGISEERLAHLRVALQRYVDEGKLAGAVVHIKQNGTPVFSEAVGWRDKEARDPMQVDTIFRIASQTKALTGIVRATAPAGLRPSITPTSTVP
jgi:CubicO group peptidase (beta-lactamase class C family)